MMNRFAILFAAPLIFVAPRPALASATVSSVFDTVDGAEIQQFSPCTSAGCARTSLLVTGILRGQTTPITVLFDFGFQADLAAHCQRLAMVAMAKPGKYRFGIGADNSNQNDPGGACRLTLITP
jgi:hypothetical protein